MSRVTPVKCMFIFSSKEEVKKVQLQGNRKCRDFMLEFHDFNIQKICSSERWIRVNRLPMKVWSEKLFQDMGDYNGGYLDTTHRLINSFEGIRIETKRIGQIPEFVVVNVEGSLWKFHVVKKILPRRIKWTAPEKKIGKFVDFSGQKKRPWERKHVPTRGRDNILQKCPSAPSLMADDTGLERDRRYEMRSGVQSYSVRELIKDSDNEKDVWRRRMQARDNDSQNSHSSVTKMSETTLGPVNKRRQHGASIGVADVKDG